MTYGSLTAKLIPQKGFFQHLQVLDSNFKNATQENRIVSKRKKQLFKERYKGRMSLLLFVLVK